MREARCTLAILIPQNVARHLVAAGAAIGSNSCHRLFHLPLTAGTRINSMNLSLIEQYRKLKSSSSDRNQLLRLLATSGDRDSLETLAEIMADDPPERVEDAVFVLAPLFRDPANTNSANASEPPAFEAAALFPRILDGIAHASVAAMILDLANHLTRRGQLAEHPGKARSAALIALYGQIVERLHLLESKPMTDETVSQGKRQFDESCALLIALTNTLRLIGDEAAIGKLYQVLDLGHRRLRTEAAAALAHFGQESGIEELLKMTAHSVVRNLAVAYLDELGLRSRVEDQYLSSTSQAESDLASWLAEPMQFGAAPQTIQLVDQALQNWPGFDEPTKCYLFEYSYAMPTGPLRNIGIAGPVVYSLMCDMRDFPPADIYAAYAGWQAEHEEIIETPAEHLSAEQQQWVETAVVLLEGANFQSIRPVKLGQFFGEPHVVFHSPTSGPWLYRDRGRGSDDHLSRGRRPQDRWGRTRLIAFTKAASCSRPLISRDPWQLRQRLAIISSWRKLRIVSIFWFGSPITSQAALGRLSIGIVMPLAVKRNGLNQKSIEGIRG